MIQNTLLMAACAIQLWAHCIHAQQLDSFNKNNPLHNGVSFSGFSYRYLIENGKPSTEFDLTDEQLEKIKKLKQELDHFDRKRSHELAAKTQHRKFRDQILPRIPAYDFQWMESYNHYKRAWKILTPKQRVRLDQLLIWSSCGRHDRRFGQWSDSELTKIWKLDEAQIESLVRVSVQAEREFNDKLTSFRLAKTRKVFNAITEEQRKRYLRVIDPKRKIKSKRLAVFPPFDLLISGPQKVRNEAGVTAELFFKLQKISREFENKYHKFSVSIDSDDYCNKRLRSCSSHLNRLTR